MMDIQAPFYERALFSNTHSSTTITVETRPFTVAERLGHDFTKTFSYEGVGQRDAAFSLAADEFKRRSKDLDK